jgi:hypothetical protein
MLFNAALVALAATTVAAVKPLEIRGTDFVEPDTGKRVQIVGVAYQPGGSAGYNPKATGQDPLSDPEICMRDAALMQVMGINAIRVYNLSPDINHDKCASIFNAAGMYMMLDVNSPMVGEAISSWNPWESYYMQYLNRTFAVVEAFANYPNTLLFFSGNEVINDVESAEFVPQYLRAVTRDLKNYIKNNLKRKIPVGYSAADVRDVLWDTWNYMQCSVKGEKDDESRADFFALNSYSWCGKDATFESSSYDALVEGLKSTSIPVFFSEFGCNTPQPRYWNEIQSIYSKQMTGVFSGGVVYEWTEEANNYGLVKIKGDELKIMGDYNRLKAQYAEIDWKSVQSEKARGKAPSAPVCAKKLIQEKGFDNDFTIPDVPPNGTQALIDHGMKQKPKGQLVKIDKWDVTMKVKDADGKAVSGLKVVPLPEGEYNWYGKNEAQTGSATVEDSKDNSGKDTDTDTKKPEEATQEDKKEDAPGAATAVRPLMWVVAAAPFLAMLFA